MKFRRTFQLLVSAGALAAVALTGGPASARSYTVTAPGPANLSQGVTTTTTSGISAAPARAGDPCRTSWTKVVHYQPAGVRAWTFKATTRWCWNGLTVTYHKTTWSQNVTWTGYHIDDQGWQGGWKTFNCYVAAGSTRKCSGNHEVVVGNFGTNSGTVGGGAGLRVSIQQWENYHGVYLHSYKVVGY